MQQKHMNLVQPGPGEWPGQSSQHTRVFFTWPMAQWKINGILTARVKHCDGTGETNGTIDRVEKPWVFSGGSFLGYQNLRTAIQICEWLFRHLQISGGMVGSICAKGEPPSTAQNPVMALPPSTAQDEDWSRCFTLGQTFVVLLEPWR